MKCFSFNRFKTFAAKHYAEYGRNYKISMLVLLSIWALFAIMEHSGIIGDDILNTKQVVTIAALMGMLSHVTASSTHLATLCRETEMISAMASNV